ncbi:PD40 domain-containing protein [Cephalotus follicularis]|uniref:PD40 domain-containing protein n=1 Tax=Cephalotus follicularis TaxID=3775 RepID=A0A1Q3BV94_CEPFO|nr:PD40 domain-containing protein [Cephalotus follicularis]
MKPINLWLLLLLLHLLHATADHESPSRTSIIFTTLGRSNYAFDIFTLPALDPPTPSNELQLTDGKSVNFNGHFPSPSSSSILLPSQSPGSQPVHLIYVSERNGSSNIYYDAVYYNTPPSTRSRSALQIPSRVQVPLLRPDIDKGKTVISMKDKPSLTGDDHLIYVSTHEDPGEPRTSWAAVYSTDLRTGSTQRLTPFGVSDFSPAVSPSGLWTAVASYGDRGWTGEVEELSTDIYVFLTRDGTRRIKVVQHGGWPSWVDESTLYFHKRSEEDNWISVYRAIIPSQGPISTESVTIQRVTPPGLHAFTPAASPGNHKFIAVATRRPNSSYRHIELFDLIKNEFTELTRLVSPRTHHFNPFISPDSVRVGYHKCRGDSNGRKNSQLLLENVKSPVDEITLFRVDGSFPSFSPAGDRIAYVDFPGLYVVNRDGSNLHQVFTGNAFSTGWNPVLKGVVYTSTGPEFGSVDTDVDILSIHVDDEFEQVGRVKKLTSNGKNNAFPSASPDGKWIVFRSSRSGHKNLYIMDATLGEDGGLHRLTDGPWTDTMCNWSPDGDLIAFASDRENPGSGSFELYVVHPNGTGLRKVIQSGLAGRTNHPWFSPDGKSLVFTSDYGAISAEPISNPHHYQPYGEIFTVKLDGSDLKRLTHNSFEDGTPAWSPVYIRPVDVEWLNNGPSCNFEDCHWLNKMPKQGSMGSNEAQCGVA